MLTAGNAYLAAGITSSQEAGLMSTPEFTVFQEAWQSGELPLRVYMMLRRPFLEAMETMGMFTGFGDERLRVGSLKLLADGSLIGRTAAVSAALRRRSRPRQSGSGHDAAGRA